MNKKISTALLFMLIMTVNCKKNNGTPTAAQVDITGTWTLNNEVETKNSVTTTYKASDIPCMADNQLVIKSDGTFAATYSGTDTCYFYNTSSGSEYDGYQGQNITGIWTQSGNNFVFTYHYPNATVTADATTITAGSAMQLVLNASSTGAFPLTESQTFIK